MTDITIPPEAVEAAAKRLGSHPWELYTEGARLSLLAKAAAILQDGINAWPGMGTRPADVMSDAEVYLPLPTNNQPQKDTSND